MPLYFGLPVVVLAPLAFLSRPVRWLRAFHQFRGTISAAPNFAYQLTIDHSSPEERAALNLSTMTTAMCGAEPIRAGTLQRFIDAFAPAGFQPRGFAPVYGVELDPDLAREAAAAAGFGGTVVHGDAGSFAFPPAVSYVFMFNPFGSKTLGRVVENLDGIGHRTKIPAHRVLAVVEAPFEDSLDYQIHILLRLNPPVIGIPQTIHLPLECLLFQPGDAAC